MTLLVTWTSSIDMVEGTEGGRMKSKMRVELGRKREKRRRNGKEVRKIRRKEGKEWKEREENEEEGKGSEEDRQRKHPHTFHATHLPLEWR